MKRIRGKTPTPMIKKLLTLILCLNLVWPSWSEAAITILDTFATGSPGSDCDPCSSNFTLSAGSDRKFVCIAAWDDPQVGETISSFTFNSIAMTLRASAASTTTTSKIFLYDLDEASLPSPGTYAVSLDASNTLGSMGFVCGSIQGVQSGAPRDTDTFGSDAANTNTFSLTGIVATDWVIVGATGQQARTFTWGTGQNELADFQPNANMTLAASEEHGEAAPSATMSGGTTRYASLAVAYIAAAAAAPKRRVIFIE